MKFADNIIYVAGDYDYNVRIADMALIVQAVLRGEDNIMKNRKSYSSVTTLFSKFLFNIKC